MSREEDGKDWELHWEGCALSSEHGRCFFFFDLLPDVFSAKKKKENGAREQSGNRQRRSQCI